MISAKRLAQLSSSESPIIRDLVSDIVDLKAILSSYEGVCSSPIPLWKFGAPMPCGTCTGCKTRLATGRGLVYK